MTAAAELLLRPDLGKKAYRLKARFVIGAFPGPRTLELAKRDAAQRFVDDMEKQGWQYIDRYGFTMRGPFPATTLVVLPTLAQQERWHTPSAELLPAIRDGYAPRGPEGGNYVSTVPSVFATDDWEYELSAVFAHETILTEVPDAHEEEN